MNHIKAFIWRGALGGLIGGTLGALFQWIFTEDQIRKALAIEEAANVGAAADEMFSRSTQVMGGMLANVLYGLFLGIVFAIALAVLAPMLPAPHWFHRSVRLATVLFVAWVIVPGLKYPPNPPAVGDPDTVGQRTASFAALLVASLVIAFLAWELWRRLTAKGVGPARRFVTVAAAYAGAITIAYLALPANPDENTAPATLIWQFRLDSFAGNAIIWLTIGTVVGALADRTARAARPAVEPVSVAG